MRQHQHVRIQSYIDKKYAEYRKLLPEDDVPETLIKARWARDTYYVHVKEIFALMEKEDADFVPDVLPEDLDLARQAEAATTLRNLPADRVTFFRRTCGYEVAPSACTASKALSDDGASRKSPRTGYEEKMDA